MMFFYDHSILFLLMISTISSFTFSRTASILSSVNAKITLMMASVRQISLQMKVLRMSMIWHLTLQLSVVNCCNNGLKILSSKISLFIFLIKQSQLLIMPMEISLLASLMKLNMIGKMDSFKSSMDEIQHSFTIC